MIYSKGKVPLWLGLLCFYVATKISGIEILNRNEVVHYLLLG